MRRAFVALAVAAVAFAAVTLVALEGREVVVIETLDAAGAPRRTRTWIADDAGVAWIEAATPERPFVTDLQRRPSLVLERRGVRHACTAAIASNPDGHEHSRTADRLWRKNRRRNADGSIGVDPNRNYGYMWGTLNVNTSSQVPSDPGHRDGGWRCDRSPTSWRWRPLPLVPARSRRDRPRSAAPRPLSAAGRRAARGARHRRPAAG